MPIVKNVKVKSASIVWTSPDGQRKLSEVVFDVEGQEFTAKTYSETLAVVGWSGDVETEERAGRGGLEQFVKQAPREEGQPIPVKPASTPTEPTSSPARSYQGRDNLPHTMYLSYAKDLAVSMMETGGFDADKYAAIVKVVAQQADVLFNSRPGGESN